MASAIRQMTGVGGDVRKIARLLQKKAPPGHMLAYINQEEADLLKARGGSGKPHADTGVPSFEEEYVPDYSPTSQYTGSSYGDASPTSVEPIEPSTEFKSSAVAPLEVSSSSPFAASERATSPAFANYQRYLAENTGPYPVAAGDNPQGIPLGQAAAAPVSAEGTTSFAAAPSGSRYIDQTLSDKYLPSAGGPAAPAAIAATEDKDLLGKVGDWWGTLSPDTKAKLGIGGVQAVLGAYAAQQTAEQGRKAKEELSAMAAPYQQQGKQLIAQAQRGELSPAAQQQLQAVQAQAAQGAQARGGVGAQQAQAQVEAFRQQLLQGQYDYGLKVAGIGDQIMTGAIKTGIQADQYVNNLTNTYFNNIARTLSPQLAPAKE